MALFNLSRAKDVSPLGRRRRRKTEAGSALLRFLERSRVVAVAVFLLTVGAIFIISFVGVSPTSFRILPNQISTVRIVADADFSYESRELTERARARKEREVPPVLTIDMAAANEFEGRVRRLLSELNQLDATWSTLSAADKAREVERVANSARADGGLHVSVRDLSTLMSYGDAAARTDLFEQGLFILREILENGVFDPESALAPARDDQVLMFQVRQPDSGEIEQARVESLGDAVFNLNSNLSTQNVPDGVRAALFRILRDGLRPNLKSDEAAREELRQKVIASVKPVIQTVEAGTSIIEANTRVTREQYEMLTAYQEFLNQGNRLPTGIDAQMFSRILLVLGVIIVAGFYIRLEDPMMLQSNGRLALLALMLIFSLFLIRAFLEFGNLEIFSERLELAALLPYIAPTAFAPMVIAVLIGVGPALFCGLLVSVFAAIIFGNRLDILVLSLVTTTVAAYACRAVRRRSRVVRAGAFAGFALAIFVLLLSRADRMDWDLTLQGMAAGQITGIMTGILVVGLLPVLENFFKRTTDITLLELTDFNHPLLRRMQMDAPGTYHHSLMVANLSENAANAIGANSLLCRVCCMFHDIGKLIKPEYFSENQRGGINPHADRSPSFSALIIKSHVKEGVDLAIKHKLPRPVIDVIRQHHGTTLVRYFFEQAREKARVNERFGPGQSALFDPYAASEFTFRYDGPKPQFKESAIILLADSVEAASRSLQKVTPQAVEDLIDGIIREKIEDGQIDEAPLTIRELALIKRSFTFTLLNSLHSRVVYPKGESSSQPRAERLSIPTGPSPVGSRR